MTGLHLIATAHTPALRRAEFGGDPHLDEGGRQAALVARSTPLRGPCVIAPSRAAHQTATTLFTPTTLTEEPALADPDYGTWTGHTLDQINPTDLHTWLTDPAAHPHGGESLNTVHTRTSAWLHRQTGRTLTAVAHPLIIRTLLTAALDLPTTHIRRLEVAPLATIRLTHHTHWHIHFPTP
ncbi:histidine phosphatase family protein [Actinoplanes utahensis]|uniref:histidine phosphatase family protein n=1 Tax=Actinoplanes utahensis TaxID=1869 RepID=UPI000692589C|nr:histidine phosphatase family protein [Actinoplanes utahensis]GIF34534.1 phosphoglycerate mutase [Actinoplanes utahensis]